MLHGLLGGLGHETFPIHTAQAVPMSLVIGDLQQRLLQVGAVALGDFNFGGAPRVLSRDF
jgi:hypothetical protein